MAGKQFEPGDPTPIKGQKGNLDRTSQKYAGQQDSDDDEMNENEMDQDFPTTGEGSIGIGQQNQTRPESQDDLNLRSP